MWGASKFFGGPVSFQIYWPPGPLDPQAQCQGLRGVWRQNFLGHNTSPQSQWPATTEPVTCRKLAAGGLHSPHSVAGGPSLENCSIYLGVANYHYVMHIY